MNTIRFKPTYFNSNAEVKLSFSCRFPSEYFGFLFGILYAIGGVVGFLQYAFFSWAEAYTNAPMHVSNSRKKQLRQYSKIQRQGPVLQIRSGNRDNLVIIIPISSTEGSQNMFSLRKNIFKLSSLPPLI